MQPKKPKTPAVASSSSANSRGKSASRSVPESQQKQKQQQQQQQPLQQPAKGLKQPAGLPLLKKQDSSNKDNHQAVQQPPASKQEQEPPIKIQEQPIQVKEINQQARAEDQCLQIGLRAIQLFESKNFPLAKHTFILALELIVPIQKSEENLEKKEKLKQKSIEYFQMAEECKRRTQEMNEKAMKDPMTKQVNETMMERKATIKFDEIVGLYDVKEALSESIIYPNARPDIFQGIRAPPRGILLFGPPGNGKTLIAKAVASESAATFYNVSASTFVSKNLGEGEKIVRALFASAYINQPAIIFIDEIDSILKSRSEDDHEASRRLKTEFLLQFDGIATTDQDRVIVIGATNKPEEIDSAAIRRFTKRILIDVPCQATRVNLLTTYGKGAANNITPQQYKNIAEKIEGYSCSDIKALVKEACMNPLRNIKKDRLMSVAQNEIEPVSEKDFLKAIAATPPSVSKQELAYFKNLAKQYNKVS